MIYNFERFLLTNKMLIIMTVIHKMLVKVANREDPDQTASSEAVWSGSALFVYDFLPSIYCSKFQNIYRLKIY